MADVQEVLNKAADLLEKPGAWTQGVFARNRRGNVCSPTDDTARCFCVSGAVQRVVGGFASPTFYSVVDLLNAMARRRNARHIAHWNDAPGRTQSEVVEALRAAAKAAVSISGRAGLGDQAAKVSASTGDLT